MTTHVDAERASTPSVAARALGWCGIGVTAAILLPRVTPIGNGDFFAFVSVAERLRAGDRLYADVWDNKDPLFYYALAISGSIGPVGYAVLEMVWVLVALASLAALARSQGMSKEWSLVVASGVAPWCLVGYVYTGTLSMTPGVSLTLAVLACAARNRWLAAGVVVGVLCLLKLVLVPVAVAGAVALWRAPRARAVMAAATGSVATFGVGLCVLALRGELRSYVSMLRRNSEYAGRMVDGTGLTAFRQHVERAFPGIDYPGERIAACALVLALVAAFIVSARRAESRRLALCAVLTAAACLLVLGLTAVWPHHTQMLAVPGCLALVVFAQAGPPQRSRAALMLLPAGVFVAFLMGGATPPATLLIKPATAFQPIELARGPSPEARSIAGDDVASYSRLGTNDVYGHARGLNELRLACRDFQQYPFDPETTFSRTLTCLPTSDVVFVASNFGGLDEPSEYVAFVAAAEEILATGFECVAADYGRKCSRRSD